MIIQFIYYWQIVYMCIYCTCILKYSGRWNDGNIIKNSSMTQFINRLHLKLKPLIIDGTLKAGDAMPSMRNLTKSLHVSVITAQHAYEELQKDGFIGNSCW